jgi:vancomycin permeability regulator SanA
MRYLIAMVCAVVVAALATIFLSPRLAAMVVDRFTFTSPDEVGNLEDGVFMAANFLALLMGWWLGWVLGARWVEPGETHS